MKVIHISTSNIGGGAPRAVSRIHKALLTKSIDSEIWVNHKNDIDYSVTGPSNKVIKSYNKLKFYLSRLFVKLLKTENKVLHSPQLFPSFFWIKLINNSDADIVHLHWFQHEMLSISDIKKIKKPLIWTLHDMWAFCGAEHVSYDNRFQEGYSKKNRPNSEFGFDLNRWVFKRKLRHWVKPIHLIAPSHWMEQSIRKSFLMNKWPVHLIPNTLNLKAWKPIEKKIARQQLALPQELNLILFGSASGTREYHKGFDLLQLCIKKLNNSKDSQKIGLVIFGQSKPKNPIKLNIPVFYLGYLHSDLLMRTAYSSSDLVVVPSRIESFGQVASEANACGAPVVAFKTSGLKTTILHKKTGYLARPFDIDDFVSGIYWVIKNNNLKLKKDCRAFAKTNFDFDVIAKRHITVYNEVISVD